MPTAEAVAAPPTVIEVKNPATGELLGTVPIHSAEEVRAAVARARAAQPAWAALPVKERCRQLLAFRDVLLDEAEDLCKRISAENGKTIVESLFMELILVCDLCTWYAKHAARILKPQRVKHHLAPHRYAQVHYLPRGVVGVIAPWNYPFSIPTGEVLTALFAGNGVVLKPSEVTPLISVRVKELLDRAGIPKDLVQVVTGFGATGAALIDGGIDQIVFTGSVATGKRVAVACAERLVPCTLELGGKGAAIVCADADLERAARAIVWGGFANSGQTCVAVERVYAAAPIYDRLRDRIVTLAKELRQGDPGSFDIDVGAMPFEKQLEIVRGQVEEAKRLGARILCGGEPPARVGRFFAPTVIEGDLHNADIVRKETFGPILPLLRVADEEEAIHRANDTHLGLQSYVFCGSSSRGREIAKRVESGMVMVNDVLSTFGLVEAPWGGVKQSGLGRTHGEEGLIEACSMRYVSSKKWWMPTLNSEMWWYPYSKGRFDLGMKMLRWVCGKGVVGKIVGWFV